MRSNLLGPDNVLVTHGLATAIKDKRLATVAEHELDSTILSDTFDYIALGHYHNQSQITTNAWYSGLHRLASCTARSGMRKAGSWSIPRGTRSATSTCQGHRCTTAARSPAPAARQRSRRDHWAGGTQAARKVLSCAGHARRHVPGAREGHRHAGPSGIREHLLDLDPVKSEAEATPVPLQQDVRAIDYLAEFGAFLDKQNLSAKAESVCCGHRPRRCPQPWSSTGRMENDLSNGFSGRSFCGPAKQSGSGAMPAAAPAGALPRRPQLRTNFTHPLIAQPRPPKGVSVLTNFTDIYRTSFSSRTGNMSSSQTGDAHAAGAWPPGSVNKKSFRNHPIIIDRLVLKNFKSLRHEEIRFQDGITGILGNNGTGKSSIVQAIFFALYGVQATGIAADYIVSGFASPKERCEVRLDFSVGGEKYAVVRTFRKGKTVQHDAEFYRAGKMMAKGVGPVEAEVRRTLGMGPVDFKNTIYAGQKDSFDPP